jgi:hypothetical protein
LTDLAVAISLSLLLALLVPSKVRADETALGGRVPVFCVPMPCGASLPASFE